MSAIHAPVSCGLSQVSVTARMSIVLEIIRCGGQADVMPDHRSRIKTNISR